jgi:hypothetical protein
MTVDADGVNPGWPPVVPVGSGILLLHMEGVLTSQFVTPLEETVTS